MGVRDQGPGVRHCTGGKKPNQIEEEPLDRSEGLHPPYPPGRVGWGLNPDPRPLTPTIGNERFPTCPLSLLAERCLKVVCDLAIELLDFAPHRPSHDGEEPLRELRVANTAPPFVQGLEVELVY